MKLRTRYFKVLKENPYWSDTNCLANALLEGEKYSKADVGRVFKLVDKTEYGGNSKDTVLDGLFRLNSEQKDQ